MDVIVTLVGIPDNTRVKVTLTNVNGAAGAFAAVGFLAGDVNGSGRVNAGDIAGVKARKGQTADVGNFRFDVNASGAIDASDERMVKARAGLGLP